MRALAHADGGGGQAHMYLPEDGLEGAGVQEEFVDVVKVGEVRIGVDDPERLNEDDGADVELAGLGAEEWLALDPGDDVVERIRDVEQEACRRDTKEKSLTMYQT